VVTIAENGGRPISMTDRGILKRPEGDGRLPALPIKALSQLRRSNFLTVERDGCVKTLILPAI